MNFFINGQFVCLFPKPVLDFFFSILEQRKNYSRILQILTYSDASNTSDLSPAIYKKLNSLWKIEDEKFVYMANIYMKLGQIEQAHQIYKRLLESK